jgi:hypothetical protein
VKFHVLQEHINIFSPSLLETFHRWVDIVLSVDDICTLIDVVIINPIRIDVKSRMILFQRVAMTLVAQVKKKLY